MGPFRWITLGALLALSSCDVGAAVFLMSKDDGGGDDVPVLITPPGPEFLVSVAWLPDDVAADAAKADLIASNGRPSGPPWIEAGTGTATTLIDLSATVNPTTINTILIRANSQRNYRLDSLEVLDDQGRVVEHASGSTWSNLVTLPDDLLGAPDGSCAVTNAVDSIDAFIFTRYTGSIAGLRINAHADGALQAPGDVMAVGGLPGAYEEIPGGMAIDGNGLIHVTVTVLKDIWLARYGLDGVFVDAVQIDQDIKTTVGSHSVALDGSGEIFTAATIGDGRVLMRSFHPDLGSGWNRTIYSGRNTDRVEANGIAVDESGNVVVAGGMGSTQGVNHWLAKLAGSNGAVTFDFRPGGDPQDTYWHAVTTGPGDLIYTSGDHTSGLLGVVQILTGRFSSAGAGQWEDLFGDSDAPADVGQAVALDSSGNLFMAGYMGTLIEGRNAVLLRYGSTGILSALTTFNGAANGDDEILDIALDTDGSIYAVGHETVAGQGLNIWVRKYDSNFNPVWTRTHDGGFGDDRAISVAIHGDQLVVAGNETVSGGLTKFVLRVYAK